MTDRSRELSRSCGIAQLWERTYAPHLMLLLSGSAAAVYSDAMITRNASAFLFLGFLAACTTSRPPLRTVPHVDLPRYMGDWYVIANIPYFAEKNCVDSIESYALRPDGRIDNWFQCRKKSFEAPLKRKATATAVVKDTSSNALWTVRFLNVFPVKYLILDLDPSYQWVAVGHPSRRYGWIMARTKTLPDATYNRILAGLAAQGYDPTRFVKVPQQSSNAAAH